MHKSHIFTTRKVFPAFYFTIVQFILGFHTINDSVVSLVLFPFLKLPKCPLNQVLDSFSVHCATVLYFSVFKFSLYISDRVQHYPHYCTGL